MSFAVIKLSNKQYLVKSGQTITVENLRVEEGKTLKVDQVLLVANTSIKIGRPLIKNVEVTGKIVSNFKGKKITVTRFKPKSRYLRRTGFRPKLTQVEITKIGE